jgi:hypothetical protein
MSTDHREDDQVFVLRCSRILEGDWTAGKNWRVQVSVVEERRRYLFEGIESAFDFVSSRLGRSKIA